MFLRLSTFLSVSLVASSVMWGAGQNLSVTNYQFVSSTPVTVTKANVTYRADLVNPGSTLASVTATLTSLNPSSFTVVQGKNTLSFESVPANGQITSSNTFTILVDRTVTFDFANLQWSFQTTSTPPVANAGPNQTVQAGASVTLNGSGSTNPSGTGTLSYSWAFTATPAGSTATLSNAASVMPTFVADLPGNYTALLTVSNGKDSSTASVTISTIHTAPVANAGPNQTVKMASTVILNGNGSSSSNGKLLTYKWTLTPPSGSAAALSGANTVSPSFTVDQFGNYVAQLIVNDGISDSAPSTVTISTSDTPPVANAGASQTVTVNSVVQLNGAGSTDVDGNLLTYTWSLISMPAGSKAALSNPASVNPTFTADASGIYVAQLIVNDQYLTSAPATVTISTNTVLAPTANAGMNQTVSHGTTVSLGGSGTDPQNLPLTYSWSLTSVPTGSAAVLANATSVAPQFLADVPGTYVAQLVVNNGTLSSAPSTVTITTTNTPPVANPGTNQSMPVGATITLNGSASSDADHDAIAYSWKFLSVPNSSAATLNGANTATPTFVADQPGNYVAQLIVSDSYANSVPQTVMNTAGNIVVTPNPLNLTTASTALLTVTLPSPAPVGSGGQLVTLSSDSSAVAVQGSILVPEGSATATALVTPVSPGTANIVAVSSGFLPGSTSVTVAQAVILLSPDPVNVGVSLTATGNIVLNGPAPAGGTTITLTSSNPSLATVTPTVMIPSGSNTGTFSVTGLALSAGQPTPIITATATGYLTGTTEASVITVGKIFLPANVSVAPGQSVTYPVTLATPAPVGGVTITLMSDSANASVTPSTVFIAGGQTTPATQPTLVGGTLGTAHITASNPALISDTETVTVSVTLTFSPPTLNIYGNATQNLTLQLSAPTNQPLQINLMSSDPTVATVPSSVTIQATGMSVAVPVTGLGTKNGTVTITASSSISGIANATATVNNLALGGIVLPASATVGLAQTVPFSVSLPTAAPTSVTVNLTSSDPTTLTISPASVTIPANATAPPTQPQITGLAVGTASITASTPNGFSSSTAPVNVTASANFSPNSLNVTGGATQNATLNLSAVTPKPLTINLHSDNTSLATVPATVTIPALSSSVSVPITGVAGQGGPVLVHASATNIPDTTIAVTVGSTPTISLQSGITVAPGQSVPIAVSVSVAPQSALTINLASSVPTVATISPATVTINAGATTPTVQPMVTGITFGPTSISATATGYLPAAQVVQVGASLSFPMGPLSLSGGLQNITLTLSAPAPAGGLTVNLMSSNPSAATVPSAVAFLPNLSTVSVPVTGLMSGSTTITASSSAPNVNPASVMVIIPTLGTLTVPANIAVAPSQTAPLTLSVAPAATSNLTVMLSSSNPAIATVTPSVVIPAGATVPSTQPVVTGVGLGTVTITASAPGYVATSTTAVAVNGALSFQPVNPTVSVGAVQNITLNLNAPAPANFTVTLNSSNTGVATVPATVTFPANATSVTVPVTGVASGSAAITASSSISTVTSATANVLVETGIILPANVVTQPGFTSTPFPVSLASPAQSTVFITLTSSDPSVVALSFNGASSTTFTIQPGQTVPTVSTKVFGVNFGTATITASSTGYSPVSTTVQVTSTIFFSPGVIKIPPGSSKLVTLVLANPASNGLTVNLSSDNPNVATVPATVMIPANTVGTCQEGVGGSCQVVFSVAAGNLQDSTLIHASAPGFVAPATATVIVGTPGPPTITTSSLPVGQVGLPYSQQLIGDGGIVPFTWSIVGGTLPAGLTLNSATGLLSGMPTVPTNTTLTFQITDSTTPTPLVATKQLQLTVLYQGALFVTSSSLPNAVLGTPYTAQLTAAGGTTPYTWSLTSGSTLPAGLTLSSAGVISGTPTALVSNDSVTFQVTDSASPVASATKTLSITVAPSALTITTTSLPNAIVNQPYSSTLQAVGGSGAYTWSIVSGNLPGNFTLNPTTGQISSTSGPICLCQQFYAVTFQVSDSAGHSTTAVLPLTVVSGQLVFLTTALPNGQVGVPYSFALTAQYGKPPYTWTYAGLLPSGLTLNSATGVISGTPTAATSANGNRVNITVTDSAGASQYTIFSLVVNNGPPSITTASLPAGAVGTAYSATVTANGGTAPYTYTITGLPAGLTYSSSTGVIGGTPTTAGTASNVVVNATDSNSLAAPAKTLSIVIVPQLSITTGSVLPGGSVNGSYSTTLGATGGTGGYTWSATGLPAGLSLNSATGIISGTPTTTVVNASVVATVSDAGPPVQNATKTFSITISNGLAITTASPLPAGVQNMAYSTTLSATNGTGTLTWSATGLPGGLGINASTGVISGTPSSVGTTNNIMVTVKDSASHTASSTYSITISGPLAILTTSPLPGGIQNATYNATMTAGGGTAPYTWSATGFPVGLTISSSTGAITGTPSTTGTASVAITVKDSGSPQQTVTGNFSITIVPVLAITTASLPSGTAGDSYTASLMASGGVTPYTWTTTGLPGGLSINSSTGVISGAPSGAFSGNVTVQVTDSSNPVQSKTATLQLVINGPLQITTASPLSTGTTSVPYGGQPLQAAGGQAPYTWSATGLPAGLSINSASGQIVGTPSAAGTTTGIVVTVNDSFTPKNTASKTFSLTIANQLAITSTPVNGTQSSPYTFTMTAVGGAPPYTWSATGLPTGLSINSSSGVISGTPTAIQTASAMITVKDSNSQTVSNPYTITIGAPMVVVIVTPISVGQNLQTTVALTAAMAAPVDTQLTLTTDNVGIAGFPPVKSQTGVQSQYQVALLANSTLVTVPVIGVAVGTAHITVSGMANGYAYTGSGTVTVTPSGFTMIGQGGLSTLNLTQGVPTSVTVAPVQLDSSGNILSTNQPVASTTSAVVPLVSSNTGCVMLPGSVTFAPGVSSQLVQFTPPATGNQTACASTLTATPPAGFVAPSNNANAVIADVNGASCSLPAVTVGQNLAATAYVNLSGVSGGSQITVQSTDSTKVLLACAVGAPTCTGTTVGGTGASQIILTLSLGATRSPNFYVYGLGSPGSNVNYTAGCGTFGNSTGTVTVAPSGFVLGGVQGPGMSIVTGVGTPTNLTISAVALNSSLAPAIDAQGNTLVQPLAGGLAAYPAVNVSENPSNVGSVSPSQVTFAAGQSTGTVAFTGASQGFANISIATPAGFTTPSPSYTSVTAQVFSSNLSVCGAPTAAGVPQPVEVGYHLQVPCAASVSQPTTTDVTVTLSSNSSQLLLSTSPTQAGSPTITVTIPAGHAFSNQYYVQGLASSGTATYTGSASGYNSSTGTINLMPAGLIMTGPAGQLTLFTTSLEAGASNLGILFYVLDPSAPLGLGPNEQLAGGFSIPLSISDNSPSVATVSSPTAMASTQEVFSVFTPMSSGQTTVTVNTPAGFATTGYQSLNATVNP